MGKSNLVSVDISHTLAGGIVAKVWPELTSGDKWATLTVPVSGSLAYENLDDLARSVAQAFSVEGVTTVSMFGGLVLAEGAELVYADATSQIQFELGAAGLIDEAGVKIGPPNLFRPDEMIISFIRSAGESVFSTTRGGVPIIMRDHIPTSGALGDVAKGCGSSLSDDTIAYLWQVASEGPEDLSVLLLLSEYPPEALEDKEELAKTVGRYRRIVAEINQAFPGLLDSSHGPELLIDTAIAKTVLDALLGCPVTNLSDCDATPAPDDPGVTPR